MVGFVGQGWGQRRLRLGGAPQSYGVGRVGRRSSSFYPIPTVQSIASSPRHPTSPPEIGGTAGGGGRRVKIDNLVKILDVFTWCAP